MIGKRGIDKSGEKQDDTLILRPITKVMDWKEKTVKIFLTLDISKDRSFTNLLEENNRAKIAIHFGFLANCGPKITI